MADNPEDYRDLVYLYWAELYEPLLLLVQTTICYALSLSRIWLLVTPWTVARQASLAMGLPRQEFWSGLLFPPPEDLIDPGIEPVSPALEVDSLPPWKLMNHYYSIQMELWKYCPFCSASCF